jgi:hypothetical protein
MAFAARLYRDLETCSKPYAPMAHEICALSLLRLIAAFLFDAIGRDL